MLAETWITASVVSHHAVRGYCEFNPGLGIEHGTSTLRAVGGFYRNSFCEWSGYAGASWLPIGEKVKFGITAAAFSGYRSEFMFAALPVLAIEGRHYGLNLVLAIRPHKWASLLPGDRREGEPYGMPDTKSRVLGLQIKYRW